MVAYFDGFSKILIAMLLLLTSLCVIQSYHLTSNQLAIIEVLEVHAATIISNIETGTALHKDVADLNSRVDELNSTIQGLYGLNSD